ncbi:MAG: DUF5103 domain-containing protein [Bacteroidota bacterium]
MRILQVIICLNFCFFFTLTGNAQPEEYVKEAFERNIDFVYKENIHGVQLIRNGDPFDYPIVGDGDRLELLFDDLDNDVKDYSYTLIHCNADWTPSNLNQLEYINGFAYADILDYEYSFNTEIQYTNYRVVLPNDDMEWTKSGNYLLKVFVNNNEEDIVLTRRFMVVEPRMNVNAELVRPFAIERFKSHHEIDFVVNHRGITVRSPKTEINVAILQNGRWDNAITGLEPLFIRGDDLIFDYQNQIVFQAGREFRFFDARSTRFRSDRIREIEEADGMYHLSVSTDKVRSGVLDQQFADINGAFCIGNFHEDEPDLESDYVRVYFELPYDQPDPFGEIYIFGKLTDWQLKEEFKMQYNENYRAYIGSAFLKQGYYNYQYVYLQDGAEVVDFELIEGNWWETDDDYHILVYYRPFGERYDRLVGISYLNSNPIRNSRRLGVLRLENK